ncbi:MAG: ATP-binding protein [Lachnospiraceae bacterium]|nr:ATP-binding protein [Lachnospiraceae bacterium]
MNNIDSTGKGNQLIKNTYTGIFVINAVAMISAMLCQIVDAVVTGQFLGTAAVAAYGLITPIVMLANLLCNLLGPGVNIICTRHMGKARPDRCNQVFSIVMIADTILVISAAILFFLSAPSIAYRLGETADAQVQGMMIDYIRGFVFAMPSMCLSMGLGGIMMLDNDRKRSLIALLVTFAGDVILDLANVLFFHGGMLGMAAATSVSTFLGALVLLSHFFTKNHIVRFTPKGLRLNDLKEVLLCGISSLITLGSQAIRIFMFNALLLAIAGSGAVAALAVANSAFSIIINLAVSMLVTTSTLCSMLYGEEDRSGLIDAVTLSLKTAVKCFIVIAAFLMVFAHPVAAMFLSGSAAGELSQAARFIRFISIQYLFASPSFVLCGAYQGTKRMGWTYWLSFLRECVTPILCCMVLGRTFGLSGMESGFIAAGILTLICCFVPLLLNRSTKSAVVERLMLLSDHFGAKPEDMFEAEMKTMDDVMDASRRAFVFCENKGMGEHDARRTSLFVEEVCGNTVLHGFTGRREGIIDMRIVVDGESEMIRFRDNGTAFDPVDWLKRCRPEDPTSATGIAIVVGLAKDVQYIPAMGLNNLIIQL